MDVMDFCRHCNAFFEKHEFIVEVIDVTYDTIEEEFCSLTHVRCPLCERIIMTTSDTIAASYFA